jgi:hypothetical protein
MANIRILPIFFIFSNTAFRKLDLIASVVVREGRFLFSWPFG